MYKYQIKFTGRKLGAIGTAQSFCETVTANCERAAVLALYDRFEHIGSLEITPLDPEKLAKIPLKQIRMIRAEGPVRREDTPYPVGRQFVFESFADAEHMANQIRKENAGKLGYDKTDAWFLWADGEEIKLRLDIGEDFSGVRAEVLDFVRFHTGKHCPDHMSEQQYKDFLSGYVLGSEGSAARYEATCKEAIEFLQKYELE